MHVSERIYPAEIAHHHTSVSECHAFYDLEFHMHAIIAIT